MHCPRQALHCPLVDLMVAIRSLERDGSRAIAKSGMSSMRCSTGRELRQAPDCAAAARLIDNPVVDHVTSR